MSSQALEFDPTTATEEDVRRALQAAWRECIKLLTELSEAAAEGREARTYTPALLASGQHATYLTNSARAAMGQGR